MLETGSTLGPQEANSPEIYSPKQIPETTVPRQALPTFVLPLVLVLLVTSAAILLLKVLQRHRCCRQKKAILHLSPGLAWGNSHTPTPSSPGSPKASEAGNSRSLCFHSWAKVSSRHSHEGWTRWTGGPLFLPVTLCLPELPNLASQPLSRLLDELEVLEELIMLLDPEPGPGGALACGTTRHLAARYGLPAAWSTFAYSLRPSRSPLRALIEMVVAREPSTSLGQFGTHLAQLGRVDALQVLCKLG